MTPKTLIVSVRVAYGKTFVDPINDLAYRFCELAGQSTLTSEQVRMIKALGFKVEVQAPDPNNF